MLRMTTGTPIPIERGDVFHELAAVLPNRLGIPFRSQRPNTNLCWAACAQMVLHGKSTAAATICGVTSAFFDVNCCPDPTASGCNIAEWPVSAYNKLGFYAYRNGGSITLDQAKGQVLDAKRPIQAYLQGNSWAHTVVVVDILETGYRIYDPWSGPLDTPSIEAAYGAGTWQDTYYGIATKPLVA